jgi:small-conductance mechanosensitive channel
MDWLGIHWVGLSAENGQKALLTIAVLAIATVISAGGRALIGALDRHGYRSTARFWSRQALAVSVSVATVLALLSIWLDNPARLTTAMGLATAGIAFALQKVITSLAGYIVILRGKTFTIGDRITMGGVRGDVISLGFMQTTIMEMGQPPSVQNADPAMWVRSRQFTGRIVTVANSRIFDEPVYNYTRDFPYIWEETSLPIGYRSDCDRAERILLAAARRHAVPMDEIRANAAAHLRERFAVDLDEVEPRVFYRLTDNWIELTARFLVPAHGVRAIKDRMSRELLRDLRAASIDVASGTYDIVGLPPIRVRVEKPERDDERRTATA